MSEPYPPPREEEIWRPDAGGYIPAWSRSFLKSYGVHIQWAKSLPPLEDSLAYVWLKADAPPVLIWLRRRHGNVQVSNGSFSAGGEGYQLDGSDVIFDSFRDLVDALKGEKDAV